IPFDQKAVMTVGGRNFQIMAELEIRSDATLFIHWKKIVGFNTDHQGPGFYLAQRGFHASPTTTYVVAVHCPGKIIIGLGVKPFTEFLSLILLVGTSPEVNHFFRIVLLGLIECLIIPIGKHSDSACCFQPLSTTIRCTI